MFHTKVKVISVHRVSIDSGLVGDNCDETVEFQINGQLFLKCSWKFVGKL